MNQTLINASPIEVIYKDGTKEAITLRELTIRQLYKFTEYFGSSNSPALVALCAGKEDDWPDTLADDSYAALVKEAIRLNFPRAANLVAADITVAARLAPAIRELAAAETLLAGEHSKTRSPAPAASESAEGIGSGS